MSEYLHSIDDDGSGVISAAKLEECLHIIGFFPTDDDIQWLIKHFDTNSKSIAMALRAPDTECACNFTVKWLAMP